MREANPPGPDLFDYASRGREQGVECSSRVAGPEWKDYAVEFVRGYLVAHRTLFVDDLWSTGLRVPESPRALGAVIQEVVKAGWMEERRHDGSILAKPSVRSNLQLKRVWKSRLYRGQ